MTKFVFTLIASFEIIKIYKIIIIIIVIYVYAIIIIPVDFGLFTFLESLVLLKLTFDMLGYV